MKALTKLIALALMAVAATGAHLVDASPWLLVGAVAIVWTLILRDSLGIALAIAVVTSGALLTVLAALMLSAATSATYGGSIGAAFLGWGTLGLLFPSRRFGSERPRRSQWVLALCASAGAVVWAIAQAVTSWQPDYDRLTWVMRNDSLHNLLFARQVLHADGVLVGALENPAPLPSALIAVTAGAGRDSVPPAVLLQHDLAAFALTWGTVIAITCVLAGILGIMIVRSVGGSEGVLRVTAVATSVIVLSWGFTGYAIEYGFVNTQVAVALLVIAMIAFLQAREHPWVSLVVLLVTSVLVLATWSPLVVIPLSLAAFAAIRERSVLLRLSWARKLAIAASAGVLGLYGAAVSAPVLLSQRSALAASGGIFDAGGWVPLAAAAAWLLAAWPLRRFGTLFAAALLTVAASSAGMFVLLFASRNAPTIWSYYPIKFGSIVSLLALVMCVGLLFGWVSRLPPQARWYAVLAPLTVVVATVAWTPDVSPFRAMNPVARLVSGGTADALPAVHRAVFELHDPAHPTIAWNYLEWGEGEVNVWLINLAIDSLKEKPALRELAYSTYFERTDQGLCSVAELSSPGLVVYSMDAQLRVRAESLCPGSGALFVAPDSPP